MGRAPNRFCVLTVVLLCWTILAWGQCPTADGDETSYGSNEWIGYIYDGVNTYSTANYQGTITESTIFDQSFCGPNCDFTAETGCNVNTETFSVRFKNRQSFSCGQHTFTVGSDYGVRFSIDGGNSYLIDRAFGTGYATTDTTVFLTGGEYELTLEYFHIAGTNRVSFAHSEVLGNSPGEIAGNQTICDDVINPVAFTSLSPAKFCSQAPAAYQWQQSADGSEPWTNIPGATSAVYDVPPGDLVSGDHFFRRRAFDGATEIFSNVISVVAESPGGDGVSFVPNVWTGYTFNGADNYNLVDYLGYFQEPLMDFAADFSGTFNGCTLPAEDFSVRFKREETIGTCGGYDITIGAEGGGVRLYLDGALVINGYTSVTTLTNYSANMFLSAGTHQFVLEYYTDTNPSSVTFQMAGTGVTGGAGVVGGDQATCGSSYDPEPFTSLKAADYCGGVFSYQWQQSLTGGSPWNNIGGATNETYDESAALAPGTYYYRRVAIAGAEQVASNTVVVDIVAPLGDEVTYASAAWRGYVYEGANSFDTEDYLGYFDTPAQNFSEDFSAVTLNGCTMLSSNFSVRFRRELTLACGGYDINVDGDDRFRIYIDNTELTNGYSTTYSGNVFLDGPHEFDIEFFDEEGSASIDFTIVPTGVPGGGGVIGSNQDICSAVLNPAPLQSIVDAGYCSPGSDYQWQNALDPTGPWTDIPSATSNTYDPPVVTAGVHYYRRAFSDGIGAPVYSNIVRVSAFTPIGDGVTYGNDGWIGYVYDNENDFANDFMGSFTKPTNFTESFCGSDCNFSINGCPVQTESFSVHFRNEKLFECGSYLITIGGDDGVRLDVDGVTEIDGLTRQLYTTYSKTIYFDGSAPSKLDLYYFEWSFGNRVSFSAVYLGPGNAGEIGGDQVSCQSGIDPDPFTSIEDANFDDCLGPATPITYQWQKSLDGFGWENILGANSATYDEASTLSATHYYRRQATAGTFTLNSNVVVVEVDPPQGDRITFGDNEWIGYVYKYDDTPPETPDWNLSDYQGYMLEPTIFNETFCGVDCTQEIFGCDFNTQNFAMQLRNEMTLECGNYEISVTFKDGARLYIDGVLVPGLDEYWLHDPTATLTETVFIDDNPTSQHQFILEYRTTAFQNVIGFNIQYLGAGEPAVIGDDQVLCSAPFDPRTIYEDDPAVFLCTGDITPTYQWQISVDGVAWSDIPGATSIDYNPPAGHAFTRYYRRQDKDDAGNELYSNTITLLYNTDAPPYTGTEFGTAPEWIGHVYDGDNNFTNYQGSFIETMTDGAFDESFCGPNCIFEIDGCDIVTTTFTVQFRTRITLDPGSYTFTIGSEEGARLSIGGAEIGSPIEIINDYTAHAYRTASNTPIDLLGGTYDLILDFYDKFSGNRISFSYIFTPLPVTWHYFNGYYADDKAYIEWRTASEINNSGFEVERSNDGANFTNIGWVEGNGSTTVEHQYLFTDENPEPGWNYYRLKQIDYDGKFEYSRLIPVFVDDLPQVEIYPNPFRDHLYLSRINTEHPPEVTLTNILGQRSWVLVQDAMQPARFNLPTRLEPGVYSARIRVGDATYTRKVIIE